MSTTSVAFGLRRTGLALAALLCVQTAIAVAVDPAGQGDVLIYPYFSTANGNATLLKLTNLRGDSKALKLRLREAGNGRELASFNLYLGPFDIWSGALFSEGESEARLLTQDGSCTVPRILFSTTLPRQAADIPYLPLSTAEFSGLRADGGPTGVARTREGWIEVFEMGRLAPGSAADIAATAVGWPPTLQDCGFFERAWEAAGRWSVDPTTDLLPPTGGLTGTVQIIDVAHSTLYSVDATALSHFSVVVQHSAPGSALPDLSSAVTDPARREVEALLVGDGVVYRSRWPQARAIDAVSAALLRSSVGNAFNVEAGLDAGTDWMLTAPTRPFYTDPARVNAAVPPFTRRYAGGSSSNLDTEQRCEPFAAQIHNREQQLFGFVPIIDFIAVLQRPRTLCRAAQAIEFYGSASRQRSDTLGSADAMPLATPPGNGLPGNGEATLPFDAPGQQLGPDLQGQVFGGLPVIGFAATRLRNLQARPGEIGNYTGATAFSGTVACVSPSPACLPR